MPAKMKIRSAYATLPSAERKVADFILENPERAMHMVINEIAESAGVSVPSVTRLARKLGYKGFLEFRVALASGAAISPDSHRHAPVTDEDTDEIVLDKVYGASIRALEDTYRALDKARFCELAARISTADRVLLIGGGGSLALAEDAAYHLCLLGVEAVAVTDPVVLEMYKSRFNKNDIVIGLSRAGRNKQLADGLKAASSRGAVTVSMSNFVNAQASQTVDYFFCTSRIDDVKKLLGAESSNAMVALINTLLILVARNLKKTAEEAE